MAAHWFEQEWAYYFVGSAPALLSATLWLSFLGFSYCYHLQRYPSHSWHLTQAGQIGAFFWDFARVEEAARCQNPKACQHPWFLPSREGCQQPKSVIINGGSWHFEFLVQPTPLRFCFNSGLDCLSQQTPLFVEVSQSCVSVLCCYTRQGTSFSGSHQPNLFLNNNFAVVVQSLSRVSFETPRTVARQAPLSMEFSRQEYWSGLPFPSWPRHRTQNA